MRALLLFLFAAIFFVSCTKDNAVSVPDFDPEGEVRSMASLSDVTTKAMEGVYAVVEGKQLFGDEVVVKAAGGGLSLFTGRDAAYCLFVAGQADSTLHLAGYWRKQVNEETGIVRLSITMGEGAGMLQRGKRPAPGGVIARGSFGNAAGQASRDVVLRYRRPLYTGASPFLILAHRAGGRNSDRLPASENSAELVRMAERFGATGVEIDVQLTSDGVPVIYHDESLNLRLTQKSGLVGSVSDYTLAQLESIVRLKNGERIPTLKRMLATILRQTDLRYVWIDSKPSVPLALLRDLQRRYEDSARVFGRELIIVIGLPDEEKVNEMFTLPDYQDAHLLCELDVETTRRLDAEVWAPRWTLGTQTALVSQMQAEGRKALVWTLDDAAYIQEFLRDGQFDGMLTNYPSLVAYYYYVQ